MELILILVYAVLLWVLYHKVFDVYYFDLSAGIGKEIFGSLIGGAILAALTLMYWGVVVILIAIVALVLAMKFKRTEQRILVAVVAAIIAIAVAVTGISFNNREKDSPESARAYSHVTEDILIS